MPNWDFTSAEPIDLDIEIPAGSIAVTAEPADAISVSVQPRRPGPHADDLLADLIVEFSGGKLTIAAPKTFRLFRSDALDVRVTVPEGSRCAIRTASCDVTCAGELGGLDVGSASGSVTARTVTGPARIRTASAGVRLTTASGPVKVKTASGSVWIGTASSPVDVRTASGKIGIGAAETDVTVHTASGDVSLQRACAGEVTVNTVSGTVDVGVAAGTGVYLDLVTLSGRARSDLERSDSDDHADLQLHCRTVSGNIRVARAATAEVG